MLVFFPFIPYRSCKFQIYLFLQGLEPSGSGETNLLSTYCVAGSALGALYSHLMLIFYKVGVILSTMWMEKQKIRESCPKSQI